jgi:hypothetical protein
LIEKLLSTNQSCNLPCWWGFNVGVSSGFDWLAFLEEYQLVTEWSEIDTSDVPASEDSSGYIIYSLGPLGVGFNLGYSILEYKLRYLVLDFTTPNQWISPDIERLTLPSVLAQLETTPEIYMFTDSIGQWSTKDIQLIVIADNLGFMARYRFDISQRQPEPIEDYSDYGETLQLCLGITETTSLQMTIQDSDYFDEPVSGDSKLVETMPNQYHSLDETLGVDFETFVTFFRENPDECLEVRYLKPTPE